MKKFVIDNLVTGVGFFCVITLSLTGCSSGVFQGGGSGRSKNVIDTELFEIDSAQEELKKIHSMSFDSLKSVSIQDFYSAALKQSQKTTENVSIYNHDFFEIDLFMSEHEDAYVSLVADFASLGDYFDSINIYSEADISEENVQKGAEIVGKIYSLNFLHELDRAADAYNSQRSEIEIVSNSEPSISRSAISDLKNHVLVSVMGLSFLQSEFALIQNGMGGAAGQGAGAASRAGMQGASGWGGGDSGGGFWNFFLSLFFPFGGDQSAGGGGGETGDGGGWGGGAATAGSGRPKTPTTTPKPAVNN